MHEQIGREHIQPPLEGIDLEDEAQNPWVKDAHGVRWRYEVVDMGKLGMKRKLVFHPDDEHKLPPPGPNFYENWNG